MVTRTGQLDREITIQYKTVTRDPTYNTEVPTWVALGGARIWANWEDVPPSRSEAVHLGLEVARNQSRCRIRYRSDVTSAMRVLLHGGAMDVVYQIIAEPAMLGRQEWTEMVCERAQ